MNVVFLVQPRTFQMLRYKPNMLSPDNRGEINLLNI